MKKWMIFFPAFLSICSLGAQEAIEEEEYEIEESCEEEDFCVQEERPSYARRYYCPHRRRDYHRYEDKDIDASWPGKIENSFIEEMMR